MAKKLHWINWLPTHYNDLLFGAVETLFDGELLVHYMEGSLTSHPWKTENNKGYKYRLYEKKCGIDWNIIKEAIGNRDSYFIIGGWFEPTVILLIIILSILCRPFAIWTDTPNILKKRNRVFGWFRDIWLNHVFRNASYIMGTGKMALKVLLEMNGPSRKLVDLPYFTDINLFHPASEIRDNHTLTFLSSGRLVNSHKGYDLALQALSLVKKRGEFKFCYRIAGLGPDLEGLKTIVAEEGLSEQVEFVGWLEPSELPGFYRSGDIFLHPAIHEPYGVSVIEAMASGLAVIGSDQTGAVIDRIVHGVNGFVHPQGDVEKLAEIIIAAARDLDALGRVRSQARKTAEEWPVARGVAIVKGVMS